MLDELDLTIRGGELFALLGPNGAGKTTTVETIEGHRRPDGGTVRVFGHDPRRDAGSVRPLLGLMLQSGGLYSQLRPIEARRASSPRSTPTRSTRCNCWPRSAWRTSHARATGTCRAASGSD